MEDTGDTVAAPTPIEVERKFALGANSLSLLKDLGASLVSEKTFRDVYYDTDQYQLTLADHWLRRRADTWELKFPPAAAREDTSLCTQYRELDQELDIVRQLREEVLSDVKALEDVSDVQQMLEKAELKEFAGYTTQRSKYALDAFTIDVDATDFGFQVGEIERVVVDEARINVALKEIDELAKRLGVCPKRQPGKMETFLQRHRPQHYQLLVQAHVLRPPPQ